MGAGFEPPRTEYSWFESLCWENIAQLLCEERFGKIVNIKYKDITRFEFLSYRCSQKNGENLFVVIEQISCPHNKTARLPYFGNPCCGPTGFITLWVYLWFTSCARWVSNYCIRKKSVRRFRAYLCGILIVKMFSTPVASIGTSIVYWYDLIVRNCVCVFVCG